jgi:hypothetical protein
LEVVPLSFDLFSKLWRRNVARIKVGKPVLLNTLAREISEQIVKIARRHNTVGRAKVHQMRRYGGIRELSLAIGKFDQDR